MQRPRNVLKAMAILASCFSVMPLCALNFGAAFREEIVIVNKTAAPISVTPIGVWDGSKNRSALPVTALEIIHWPALKNGDFTVAPGQSIRIDYDGDDIDPSEIYINAGTAGVYEQSVKSREAADFDYDKDRRIEITDLSKLTAASAPVTAAALGANKNEWKIAYFCVFVFGPIVFSAGLWVMVRIFEKRAAVAVSLGESTNIMFKG